MKTMPKSVLAASQKRKLRQIKSRFTADERELLAATRLAQADYIRRFPEPAPSPAERKARAAAVKAMFAAWTEAARKNPPSREECESYDRMIERMKRERTG